MGLAKAISGDVGAVPTHIEERVPGLMSRLDAAMAYLGTRDEKNEDLKDKTYAFMNAYVIGKRRQKAMARAGPASATKKSTTNEKALALMDQDLAGADMEARLAGFIIDMYIPKLPQKQRAQILNRERPVALEKIRPILLEFWESIDRQEEETEGLLEASAPVTSGIRIGLPAPSARH